MAIPQNREPVLPMAGLLGPQPWPADLPLSLERFLGRPSLTSPRWRFDATDYYEAEMGADLERQLIAFEPCRDVRLAAWKAASNRLESSLATPSGRRVNIDPGYLSLGGLFLASAKAAPHRIELGGGFHGELTLYYRRGVWTALPWTFPDFRQPTYHAFLDACREKLKQARAIG